MPFLNVWVYLVFRAATTHRKLGRPTVSRLGTHQKLLMEHLLKPQGNTMICAFFESENVVIGDFCENVIFYFRFVDFMFLFFYYPFVDTYLFTGAT